MFDSSRYDYKRNFNASSIGAAASSAAVSSAYSDAKQSAIDENVLESKIGMSSRTNIDFERAKQKFDKPTSLRLNNKAFQTKQMLGNFLKLGQSNGAAVASKRLVESAHGDFMGKSKNTTNIDGSGGVVGSSKKEYFNMNSSLNLDELKVSEDDDVSKLKKKKQI